MENRSNLAVTNYQRRNCKGVGREALRLALLIGCLLAPVSGFAYDDSLDDYREGSTHQAINKAAVELFERLYLTPNGSDPDLRRAMFNNQSFPGLEWPIDQPKDKPPRIADRRSKPLRDWIAHGGFSADQPEWTMALLHFYDPTNPSRPWLTDQQFVVNFIRLFGGTTFANPQTDAVTWTFNTDTYALSIYLDLFEQHYGWNQSKAYLRQALAGEDPGSTFYGQAWRGVGEVMHMVADMTVPAHVRNDGHAAALREPDPYEHNTHGRDVLAHKDSTSYADLNYFRFDAEQIMRDVAVYTNHNFFSKDTIPGNPNRVGSHRHPDIDTMRIDADGYLSHTTSDGKEVLAAAPNSWWGQWYQTTPYTIDMHVVQDQQRILIPTAVRATAGILYAFLPRFEVTMEISATDRQNIHRLRGEAIHRKNFQWADDLTIRNGAFVVIKSKGAEKRLRVERPGGLPLNSFVMEVETQEGDEIWVEYDFGGYVIRSDSQIPTNPVEFKLPVEYPVLITFVGGDNPMPGVDTWVNRKGKIKIDTITSQETGAQVLRLSILVLDGSRYVSAWNFNVHTQETVTDEIAYIRYYQHEGTVNAAASGFSARFDADTRCVYKDGGTATYAHRWRIDGSVAQDGARGTFSISGATSCQAQNMQADFRFVPDI